MRTRICPVALAVVVASGAAAQAPTTAPTTAPSAAPTTAPSAAPESTVAPTTSADEPTVEERRIVAYVATGISVASLAAGITLGLLAQAQFDCAKDVLACNQGLQNKIVGTELFDVRNEIEQKALFADMAYLLAAASAIVATVGYLRGFVFLEETPATPVPAPAAALPLPPAPRVASGSTP